MRYFNNSLSDLITMAYGIKYFQLIGPSYLQTERFVMKLETVKAPAEVIVVDHISREPIEN